MKITICDRCQKPIPMQEVVFNGKKIKVLKYGKLKCKEWNFFPITRNYDLCESCAAIMSENLDNEIIALRNELLGVSV